MTKTDWAQSLQQWVDKINKKFGAIGSIISILLCILFFIYTVNSIFANL